MLYNYIWWAYTLLWINIMIYNVCNIHHILNVQCIYKLKLNFCEIRMRLFHCEAGIRVNTCNKFWAWCRYSSIWFFTMGNDEMTATNGGFNGIMGESSITFYKCLFCFFSHSKMLITGYQLCWCVQYRETPTFDP